MNGRTCPVRDPAGYLAGLWEVRRRVLDLGAETEGHFAGTATFTRDPDGLDYVEEGVLHFGGWHGPAGRTLRYRPDGPGRLVAEFADGRVFHDLDLRTGHWEMRHDCRDDVYRGEVTVLSRHYWRQVWWVAGPAKQLLLDTDYVRTHDDDDTHQSMPHHAPPSFSSRRAADHTAVQPSLRADHHGDTARPTRPGAHTRVFTHPRPRHARTYLCSRRLPL